jgi:hypothetical protein
MRQIRTLALVASAVALAFALSPAASARSCDGGEAACPLTVAPATPAPPAATAAAQQENPVKLDKFMSTGKPVSTAKRTKKSRSVKRAATKQKAPPPAVAETAPAIAPVADFVTQPEQALAKSESSVETDGVAVTSFNEMNELDAAADQVQVVASSTPNEIDLATPAPPAATETTGQSVSSDQTPAADKSWIGKLLLAAAGTIALAGAARFMVA